MKLDMPSIRQLAEDEGVAEKEVRSVLQASLLQAYSKFPNARPIARVEVDDRGNLTIWGKESEEEEETDCTPEDFNRQSTEFVRSALRQLVHHMEDEKLFGSFLNRRGQLITGTVQQDEKDEDNIHVAVGDTEALLPRREQTPGEEYRHGQRLRVYVVSVDRRPKGPEIIVSRRHPNLVQLLFEKEVPEMSSGDVSIVKIAREAGSRTKIAVTSRIPGFNAKGAFIGPGGSRVRSVVSELGGKEQIDIIDYSDDPARYIANALSPAKVEKVDILSRENRMAVAIVANEDQLRLAIGGQGGQNARLAARLTGWKIAIQTPAR
ncbi:MAG: transcription termination factor NusA [Aeriscardovia sp.]|nr:transcription termination factor NusA [Aeriscardovia sp.]MBQ5762841.1 transcription termination factor NusA [Aeriscardovia sp.]